MGNSLQDQLLKAGLANKKQAVKAKKAKNHKEKQQRSGAQVVDEAAASAEKAQQEKIERDRALNREKQAAAEEKAIQAQIRQLILLNRLEERGEHNFRFTQDATIKTLLVTESQRKALVSGALALVVLDDVEIVPRAVADKIAERDEAKIILNNAKDSPQDTANSETDEYDEYDEYHEYQVPDDLMW